MTLWFLIGGCAWWEARQLCGAAERAEAQAWDGAVAALTAGAAAAEADAAVHVGDAESAGRAIEEAARAAGGRVTGRGEAAQQAYSAASRRSGSDAGAAAARWADWAARAAEQTAAADKLTERTRLEIERLKAWMGNLRERREAAAYSHAAWLARVVGPTERAALVLHPAGSASPPEKPTEQVTTLDAERLARAAVVETAAGTLTTHLDEADRLVFEVGRAGQVASASGRDYAYLGFPAEALVASAAAGSATAAGARGEEAAEALRAVVKRGREALTAPPESAPAPEAALAAAVGASKKVVSACGH